MECSSGASSAWACAPPGPALVPALVPVAVPVPVPVLVSVHCCVLSLCSVRGQTSTPHDMGIQAFPRIPRLLAEIG